MRPSKQPLGLSITPTFSYFACSYIMLLTEGAYLILRLRNEHSGMGKGTLDESDSVIAFSGGEVVTGVYLTL